MNYSLGTFKDDCKKELAPTNLFTQTFSQLIRDTKRDISAQISDIMNRVPYTEIPFSQYAPY
jgi:hypothetical protein